MVRNILLTVEYDGSGLGGWQVQTNAPSVQGILQEAIRKLTGETVHVQGAGRTDAGVHARGQAANFKTESRLDCGEFVLALNFHLPPDVAVVDAREVPLGFHAQYDALGKVYRYRILNRHGRSALDRDRAWRVQRRLDIDAMCAGAAHLVGEHDFRAFAAEVKKEKNTVRRIRSIDILAIAPYVEVTVGGDGFLYKMVRTLVGTLALVGHGRLAPDDVLGILRSGDRRRAGSTAPAHGLYLLEVWYP